MAPSTENIRKRKRTTSNNGTNSKKRTITFYSSIRNTEEKSSRVWLPTEDSIELDEYMDFAKTKHNYSEEQALAMAFFHRYDYEKAKQDLANYAPVLEEWTQKDKAVFRRGLKLYREEGINEESFDLLDEVDIAGLFKKLGPRLIFKKHFSNFKKLKFGVKAVLNLSIYTVSNSTYSDSTVLSPDEEFSSFLNEIASEITSQPLIEGSSLNTLQSTSEPSTSQTDSYSTKKSKELENLLNKSAEGRVLLANKNKLTNKLRASLVKIIINNLISNSENFTYDSTRFTKLSEDICALFPQEEKETYYTPHRTHYHDNIKTRTSARVKLWSKYINVKAALRILDNSNSKSSRKRKSEEVFVTDESILEKINFLRGATEPITKIQQFWEDTHLYRKKKFNRCSISDIFSSFPILNIHEGSDLVNIKL
ncbi:unnamed protein product [Brassicogethes aeneus]|uniref:ELM2 domain-containing protein n=1 Tax=Brassicogethes aeneus TaxID=1431903 RepID=A0A9P0FP90_BRAAE|nr:unnamed protein product [Brassicogethes aeneus]